MLLCTGAVGSPHTAVRPGPWATDRDRGVTSSGSLLHVLSFFLQYKIKK